MRLMSPLTLVCVETRYWVFNKGESFLSFWLLILCLWELFWRCYVIVLEFFNFCFFFIGFKVADKCVGVRFQG